MTQKEINQIAKNTSDSWQLKEWEIIPGNNYIIGKHQVIFGHRLRILPIDASIFDGPIIDWCMATNPFAQKVYKNFLLKLIEKSSDKIILQLPYSSNIRPVYNDEQFHNAINSIAQQYNSILISKEMRKLLQKTQVLIHLKQN